MTSSEKPPVHSSAWIVFPPINAAHICLVYSLNSMRSTHSLATFHTSGLQNPVVDPTYFEKLWTTTKIKFLTMIRILQYSTVAVTRLSWSCTSLSLWRPGIDPWPVYMEFKVDSGSGTGFSPYTLVSPSVSLRHCSSHSPITHAVQSLQPTALLNHTHRKISDSDSDWQLYTILFEH